MRSIRMEETRFPLIMEDGNGRRMRGASARRKQLRYQELPGYTDNSIGDDGSLTVFASAV